MKPTLKDLSMHFKSMIFPLSLALLSTSVMAKEIDTQVVSVPRNTSCIKNNPCIVTSAHSAEIRNHTDTTRVFLVTYQICPEAEECRRDRYKITVAPQGHWYDSKMMTMNAKYHYIGERFLFADTILTETNGTPVDNVRATAKIQVHG